MHAGIGAVKREKKALSKLGLCSTVRCCQICKTKMNLKTCFGVQNHFLVHFNHFSLVQQGIICSNETHVFWFYHQIKLELMFLQVAWLIYVPVVSVFSCVLSN